MRNIILFLLLLTNTVGAQQIYRRVDKDGNIFFTDVPTEGSEKIELKETTTIQALEVDTSSLSEPETVKKAFTYVDVSISSPTNDETIRDNTGNVTVSVEINPGLQSGHEVVVYLDGAEKMKGTETTFNLENIDRGTHQLRVSIRDTSGRIKISSKSTTFHLQRQSVLR